MKLLEIPLSPVPNQEVSAMVAGAAHTFTINARRGALYLSVFRDGQYILRNRVLRSFAPVTGGFQIIDSEGDEDPRYDGLGTRWQLLAAVDE